MTGKTRCRAIHTPRRMLLRGTVMAMTLSLVATSLPAWEYRPLETRIGTDSLGFRQANISINTVGDGVDFRFDPSVMNPEFVPRRLSSRPDRLVYRHVSPLDVGGHNGSRAAISMPSRGDIRAATESTASAPSPIGKNENHADEFQSVENGSNPQGENETRIPAKMNNAETEIDDAVSYSGLSTRDITTGVFPAIRARSLVAISKPGDRVPELVEHARILLGGMFLPEAIQAVDMARFELMAGQTDLGDRLDEIEAAIEGLGGRVSPEQAPSAEGVLWSTLQDISRGITPDEDRILEAAAGFSHQSPAVIGTALPILFDASLRTGDTDLAGMLLDVYTRSTDTDGGSTLLLMQGRLAEMKGDSQAAFDAYAEAMKQFDPAGIEARIALADIVMARGRPGLLPGLRDILTDGVRQWRNDDLALQLMLRLASVTEDIGDRPAALGIMTRIMSEYPDSREADLARARAPMVLSGLAERAKTEEVDMNLYLVTLRDLEDMLSIDYEWIPARRVLAQLLVEKGLTRAAAAEYRGIRRNMDAGSPVEDRARIEMALEETALLIEQGENIGARAVLEEPDADRFPDLVGRYDFLSARLDLMTRDPDAHLGIESDAITLVRARLAILAGSHTEALHFYEEFLGQGKSLPSQDVPRYILAQSKVGRNETIRTVERSGDMEEEGALIAAGQSLLYPEAGSVPLSGGGARASLDNSAAALEAVSGILGKKPITAE